MLPLVGSAYNVGGGRIISANDASAGMSITQNGSGPVIKAEGTGGLAFQVRSSGVDVFYSLGVFKSPDATANYGLLSMGPGPWDGASAGHFVGSAQGTLLAGNAASGFAGNLLNLQVAGLSSVSVDYLGTFHNDRFGVGIQLNGAANVNNTAYYQGGISAAVAPFIITSAFVTSPLLVTRGGASQTGDLQQWQNSADAVLGGINASGTIYTTAGLAAARRTVTTTDQATINDFSLWCDATTAAFTETLPAANTCKNGQMVAVTKVDSSANAVTVKGSGTDTVNGAASIALSAVDSTAILITDGISKWWEIG